MQARGRIVLPYPVDQNLAAPLPYVLTIAPHATHRPQFARFADWLRDNAEDEFRRLHARWQASRDS